MYYMQYFVAKKKKLNLHATILIYGIMAAK